MISAMNIPVLNAVDVFPVSFSSRLTVDMELDPEAEPHIISSLSEDHLLCLAVGRCVTIVQCEEDDNGAIPSSVLDDMIAIEFEQDIASVCWAATGSSLLVADVSGVLHFVTATTGDILFSHRVIPAMASDAVWIESLFCINDSLDEDTSSSVLVCCLSSGTLVHISGIPFTSVSSGEKLSPSILQSLKVQKFTTTLESSLKWIYVPLTSSDEGCHRVLVIDSSGILHALCLGNVGDNQGSPNFKVLDITTPFNTSEISTSYTDMVELSGCGLNQVLLLTASGSFHLIMLDTLEVVYSYSLSGFVDNIQLNQFISIERYDTSLDEDGNDTSCDVLLSVSHAEDGGHDTYPTVSTFMLSLHHHTKGSHPVAGSVMLLDQCSMSDLGRGSSLPVCDTLFPVAQTKGNQQTSKLFIRWYSATDLSLVSCDDASLRQAFKRLRNSRVSMRAQIDNGSSDLVMLTDCISIIGYLTTVCTASISNVLIPSTLRDHVLDALEVQESVAAVMAVARGCIGACPLGTCRTLLLCAKDVIYRMNCEDKFRYIDEVCAYERCILTSSLHTWSVDFGNSNYHKLISLLPCNVDWTWKRCIRSGFLKESSIILHKHMSGQIPKDLLSKHLSPCITKLFCLLTGCKNSAPGAPLLASVEVEDILTWIQEDILPMVLSEAQGSRCESEDTAEETKVAAVIEICRFIIALSREAETYDTHPFNALSAAEVAVLLSSSLITPTVLEVEDFSEVVNLQTEAKSLQQVLRLQAALLQNWNQKLTYDDICLAGLSGALSNHLISVPESELHACIATVVRPLIIEFEESLDAMLYDWINETIKSTVISNDDENIMDSSFHNLKCASEDDDEGTDNGATVQHSRLVIVAAAIQQPEVRAKAILLLLQILPMKSDEICSGGNENLSGPLATLSSMVVDVSPLVTADARDALTEALRTRQLRQLARKHGVEGFDPRNIRQAKAVVNVIIRSIPKTSKQSSHLSVENITDVLTFVDAYSSSSIDTSGLLTKALLYRIIPSHFALDKTSSVCSYEDTTSLQVAIDHIPVKYVGIVLEDTCSYLVDLIDDISDCCKDDVSSEVERQNSRRLFSSAVTGAVSIASTFLDLRGDATSGLASNKSTVALENINIQRNAQDTFINAALYSSLKHVRKLAGEFDVYFSLQELKDDGICRELVKLEAQKRAEELIVAMRTMTESLSSSGDTTIPSEVLTPVPASLRKLCILLNVSHTFAYQKMMKYALGRGNMEVGMLIADHLGGERKDALCSDNLSANHESTIEDSNIVLDITISLCGIAAKKAQESNSTMSFTKNRGNKGSSSGNPSVDAYSSPTAPFLLSGTLLRLFLLSCPSQHMGRAIDLLISCELVLSVYRRLEGASNLTSVSLTGRGMAKAIPGGKSTTAAVPIGTPHHHGTIASTIKTSLRTNTGSANPSVHPRTDTGSANDDITGGNHLQINGTTFMRDGILMSPVQVWGPLLMFLMDEVKRRQLPQSESNPQDIEKLVGILQRSENHMLAIRVLLTSWSSYGTKKQILSTSVLALSRKVLLSLHIDTALAVSCLSTVPYDSMVRELRAAVPSIQSDFSRLQTVAKIGENLAQMWDQDELLQVFQTLQTNAKWWHTLVSHGVKVDPRTFQSSISTQRDAAIRAVVPALLQKTHGNLSLAMDYCSQFDLEAYFASLCYIENTLKQPPCGIHDGSFDWANQIRLTAATVDETMVMTTFRNLVSQIHGVDYEKIRFVCTWLLEVLGDEDDLPAANESVEKLNYSEEYQKYLDISTFLSTLSCPASIDSIIVSLKPLYVDLPAEYVSRLPLWGLINDPWKLIEPMMLQLPEFVMKLVPLCALLGLERDEFYAKRAIAYYTETLRAFTATSVTTGHISSAVGTSNVSTAAGSDSTLDKEHPLHSVREIISNMNSVVQRVSVWQRIYKIEMGEEGKNTSKRGQNSDVAAIKALQAALDEISGSRDHVQGGDIDATIKSLKSEILLELVKHNCVCSLRALEEQHIGQYRGSSIEHLVKHVGNIEDLLRSVFEVAIEQAWLLQLRSLRTTHQSVLCSYEVMSHCHTPAVAKYIEVVKRVANDLFEFHSHLLSTDELAPQNSAPSNSSVKSQLETTRHAYIGNLLTDVEFGQTGGDGDKRVMLRTDAGADIWGDAMGGGATGGGVGDLSDINPSSAELRRREDVLRAFGISVLLASTADDSTRLVYLNQLVAVSKGTGARSQRRLTARSKLRAVQAVLFTGHVMPLHQTGQNCFDFKSLRSLGGYLFCVAELQELRLPSSEETLADAIGFNIREATGEGSSDSPVKLFPNPSPLVNTWIHDEGHHSDVCELARDVLLSATSASCLGNSRSLDLNTYKPLWIALFTCIVRHGHVKALLHSLTICESILSMIFENHDLNSQIFKILARVANETANRIHQVAELLVNRNSADTSCISTEEIEKLSDASTKKHDRDSSLKSLVSRTHNVLLLSYNCSVAKDRWDSPPEDVGLTAARIARFWTVLGKSHTGYSIDSTLLYATIDQKEYDRNEFLNTMKSTSLNLLTVAQSVGSCSLAAKSIDDLALRDVLVEALYECSFSSFGVLRNFAEEACFDRASDSVPESEDKWVSISRIMNEHIVSFLKTSLSKTVPENSTNITDEKLIPITCFRVLDYLLTIFPSDVVVPCLNLLCKLTDEYSVSCHVEATPQISKSLVFGDDDGGYGAATDSSSGSSGCVAYEYIEEIIRCSACAFLPTQAHENNHSVGQFVQKNQAISVLFNWIFNSDDKVLGKVSVIILTLSPPLKKSLLLALTVFRQQNKSRIFVPDSKNDYPIF